MVRRNSPAILSGLGITGVVSTSYLSWQAGFKTAEQLEASDARYSDFRTRLRLTWVYHIPMAVSGTLAVAAIVGAARVGARRTAALSAAYAITDRAFSEYRDKVVEMVGENKEQQIRDAAIQERVNASSPTGMIISSGKVLCCELHTGRYFESDMESLRRAQNDVNVKVIQTGEATLADLQYAFGIAPSGMAWDFGWNSDKPCELSFSTALTEDKRPCITFEYKNLKRL